MFWTHTRVCLSSAATRVFAGDAGTIGGFIELEKERTELVRWKRERLLT